MRKAAILLIFLFAPLFAFGETVKTPESETFSFETFIGPEKPAEGTLINPPENEYYMLATYDGECNLSTTYYVPKKNISRRGAMALYQLIRFTFKIEEQMSGQENRYIRQFGVSHLPNDILISRWNHLSFIMPYTMEEMENNVSYKVPTNNPSGDIRSWFYTDLSPEDEATIRKIIELRKKFDRDKYPAMFEWDDRFKTLLLPVMEKYGVIAITSVFPDC